MHGSEASNRLRASLVSTDAYAPARYSLILCEISPHLGHKISALGNACAIKYSQNGNRLMSLNDNVNGFEQNTAKYVNDTFATNNQLNCMFYFYFLCGSLIYMLVQIKMMVNN